MVMRTLTSVLSLASNTFDWIFVSFVISATKQPPHRRVEGVQESVFSEDSYLV